MKITITRTKKGIRYAIIAKEKNGKVTEQKKIKVPPDMPLKELKKWIVRTFAPRHRKPPAKVGDLKNKQSLLSTLKSKEPELTHQSII